VEEGFVPSPGTPSPDTYRHHLEHGELWVAEDPLRIVGFACGDVRGPVRYLSDLFVRSDAQHAGVGRALLARAMPDDGLLHATLSSKDPRAQALYARVGMTPRWPHFALSVERDRLRGEVSSGVAILESGDVGSIEDSDAELGGRPRPQDLRYFADRLHGTPVWFERTGRRIGYGMVTFVRPWSSEPTGEAHVGPLGVFDLADGAACAMAAVRWALERAPSVAIDIPASHPALAPLLDAGCRVTYVELFMGDEFADTRRYLPSGSDLF
jgi:GNAT superfamily N-acetyltransferase